MYYAGARDISCPIFQDLETKCSQTHSLRLTWRRRKTNMLLKHHCGISKYCYLKIFISTAQPEITFPTDFHVHLEIVLSEQHTTPERNWCTFVNYIKYWQIKRHQGKVSLSSALCQLDTTCTPSYLGRMGSRGKAGVFIKSHRTI